MSNNRFSETILSDFWSSFEMNQVENLVKFMQENHVDVAAFYSSEERLDQLFEATYMYKMMKFVWVIPKKRRPFYITSTTAPVIGYHMSACLGLFMISSLICVLKKTKFQTISLIETAMFQPIHYLPSVGVLRWLIPLCMLMLVNVQVAMQSNFKVSLTVPRYDHSIQDIHDVAKCPFPIIGTRKVFMQISKAVDSDTAGMLKKKWSFQATPVTPEQVARETNRIMLVSNFNLNCFNNPQDVLNIKEASIDCIFIRAAIIRYFIQSVIR